MTRSRLRVVPLASVLALIFCFPLAGEELAPAARIDELFAEWDAEDRPGAAVAVYKDGEIIYQKGFGMADLERGVPITPQSAFEIGSISKQFTAMSIFLLEHDGKLSREDDVRKYIPEMPLYEEPITIRHLLHHLSGVRDIETLVPLVGMPWVNYYPSAEMLDLITRQSALNFPPGEQHLYSNSGYVLLARIVARVSGKSLREFAAERIFTPLGMNSTVFWDEPGQVVANRALAYSPRDEDTWGLEMWNMPFDGPAGLYTTVQDLALWDANFYDNTLGGGADLIRAMETPGLLDNGESSGYAAGLVVNTHGGLPVISHGGAWMGYRAGLRRYPEQHLTVALLSNAATINVGSGQIAALYLADQFADSGGDEVAFEPPSVVGVTAEELRRYEGRWWADSASLMRTIEVRDGSLFYVRDTTNATELGALGDGRFFMLGLDFMVSVDFDLNDESRIMKVDVGDGDVLLFEPLPVGSPESLAGFAGRYWSDDLQRELTVSVRNGAVSAAWSDEGQVTDGRLIHEDELIFPRFVPVPWYHQDIRLQFKRDEFGTVTGASLSCDMVRNVAFVKR